MSVAVEEAYNWSGSLSVGGYAFQPVAQTGTDQLYQLQPVTNAADNLTLSVAVVGYPLVPLLGSGAGCLLTSKMRGEKPSLGSNVWWGLRHLFCASNVAVSFGPTLVRGSNAEVFQQWNLRAGYEILPYVLVMLGPSFQTENVPIAPIGTLVSVPRPATTPTFASAPQTDVLWGVGLSVDLAVLLDGVAAISNSVSSPTKGQSK
jgi:hypothetical protein